MPPTGLSLFPSTSTNLPRKPSLRRARDDKAPNANGELNLKGVAFQVISSSKPSAKLQPATETIKHSLFCEPIDSPAGLSPTSDMNAVPEASFSPHSRTRQTSEIRKQSQGLASPEDVLPEDDQLAPLPQNTHFGSGSPPSKILSSRLERPRLPPNISTQIPRADILETPISEKTDSLSPLPSKTQFKPSPPVPTEGFPPSYKSGSPAMSKSSSSSGSTPPMRSMFPIYDPTKTTDRQNYYPTPDSIQIPVYLGDKVSKGATPTDVQSLTHQDSGVGLMDGYEPIPAAAYGDLMSVWKASNGETPESGRKVQFGLYQPPGNGKRLAVGTSREDFIYTLDKDMFAAVPRQFVVKKHCPTAPSAIAVAQIALPPPLNSNKKSGEGLTTIFPQAAAIHAVEAITSSPKATRRMASFDSSADSPEAARLAVTEARRRYSCSLIKRTRKRDSLGSVTAQYDLVHPSLGTCAVTVTKALSATSATGPRAKISVHHPTATPAAVMADTLNLAFLDFAHDSCVLDIPGLLSLDSHYIIDTVISALLIVAVIENDALIAETTLFEPPPRTPLAGSAKASRRVSSMGSLSGPKKFFKTRRSRKEVTEMIAPEEPPPPAAAVVNNNNEELGGLARGTIAVVELAFKASAWVIVSGVKVGLWGVGKGIEMARKRA